MLNVHKSKANPHIFTCCGILFCFNPCILIIPNFHFLSHSRAKCLFLKKIPFPVSVRSIQPVLHHLPKQSFRLLHIQAQSIKLSFKDRWASRVAATDFYSESFTRVCYCVDVNLTSVGRCEGVQNGFEPQTDTVSASLKTGTVPPPEECALFFCGFQLPKTGLLVKNPGFFLAFPRPLVAASRQPGRDGRIPGKEADFTSKRRANKENSRK